MKRERWKQWASMVFAVSLSAVVFGCSSGGEERIEPPLKPPSASIGKSVSLVSLNGCDDVVARVKEALVAEVEQRAYEDQFRCRSNGDGRGDAPALVGGEQGEGGGSTFTGTNLQEADVDEADLLKIDGAAAYAIVGGQIWKVPVNPRTGFGDQQIITPAGQPSGIYVEGGRLSVISTSASGVVSAELYDASGRVKPLKRFDFPGALLDSRRVGSKLYVVIGNEIVRPQMASAGSDAVPECPESGQSNPTRRLVDAIVAARDENLKAVDALAREDLIPFMDSIGDGNCSISMARESGAGLGVLSVVTIDLADDGNPPQNITVFGDGGTVYASSQSLYIASSFTPGWWTAFEGGVVEGAEDATAIHRFALGREAPLYKGSTRIDGHLLDNNYAGSMNSARFSMAQFSMSELEGNLRVATTVGWGEEQESRITILNGRDAALPKVGEVAGMGKGEKLYAVRFVGTKAYVVTYKRTDPLSVVDLSTPSAPAITGELEVPGFSTYLHPLDDGSLIGLGFATSTNEWGQTFTEGLKLSLFDVSDAAHPAEVGNRAIGGRGSYSPAVEEHHAFTLDQSRNILSLPVDVVSGMATTSIPSFVGVILFAAQDGGRFDTIGKIILSQNVQNGGWNGTEMICAGDRVLRTAIIGDEATDAVVTLASSGLLLNRIDEEMTEVGRMGSFNFGGACPRPRRD